MSHLTLYFGFVVAVAVTIAITQWVWNRQIQAMPDPPHWMEAYRLIWVDWYLMNWDKRPRVIWAWGKSFHNQTGRLVAGEADSFETTVAIESADTPVSATAFAHELWHVALRYKGLSPDGEHVSAAWGPQGIVEKANEALKARGW